MSNSPGTLLVVEDEALIAAEIEAALKQAGYQVLPPARTASEAMDLARAHHPALTLVDIELDGQRSGI
jgi:DNA-binding response OmpR family regulator